MRHAALTLALTLLLAAGLVTASGEAWSSSHPSFTPQYRTSAIDDGDPDVGADGDPDQPTVDRPRAQSSGMLVSRVEEEVPSGPLARASWEVWLTRLLQLMGYR
jgi:hypothetical protein